jgi:hypothetical protein
MRLNPLILWGFGAQPPARIASGSIGKGKMSVEP